MSYLELLERKLTERFSVGDWPSALSFLQDELVDAAAEKNPEKEAWIHLLAGVCYQKWGHIENANKLFNSSESLSASKALRSTLFLYKSKTASQEGDFDTSKKYLLELYNNSSLSSHLNDESRKTLLWRLGLACLLTQEEDFAQKLFREHRSVVEPGGFREANNILFNEINMKLCTSSSDCVIDENILQTIRYCAKNYARSKSDTKDKLAHSGKPIVHTLLLESLYHWKLDNKFTAFQQILVGAEFLKRWYLTSNAEGVGEMLFIVGRQVPVLMDTLKQCVNLLPPHFISWVKDKDDSSILLKAYRDAANIASRAIEARDLLTIYEYWPSMTKHDVSLSNKSIEMASAMENSYDNETIFSVLKDFFTDEEIKTLCSIYLKRDYDDFEGASKQGKIREIVNYYQKTGNLNFLVNRIARMHPHTREKF